MALLGTLSDAMNMDSSKSEADMETFYNAVNFNEYKTYGRNSTRTENKRYSNSIQDTKQNPGLSQKISYINLLLGRPGLQSLSGISFDSGFEDNIEETYKPTATAKRKRIQKLDEDITRAGNDRANILGIPLVTGKPPRHPGPSRKYITTLARARRSQSEISTAEGGYHIEDKLCTKSRTSLRDNDNADTRSPQSRSITSERIYSKAAKSQGKSKFHKDINRKTNEPKPKSGKYIKTDEPQSITKALRDYKKADSPKPRSNSSRRDCRKHVPQGKSGTLQHGSSKPNKADAHPTQCVFTEYDEPQSTTPATSKLDDFGVMSSSSTTDTDSHATSLCTLENNELEKVIKETIKAFCRGDFLSETPLPTMNADKQDTESDDNYDDYSDDFEPEPIDLENSEADPESSRWSQSTAATDLMDNDSDSRYESQEHNVRRKKAGKDAVNVEPLNSDNNDADCEDNSLCGQRGKRKERQVKENGSPTEDEYVGDENKKTKDEIIFPGTSYEHDHEKTVTKFDPYKQLGLYELLESRGDLGGLTREDLRLDLSWVDQENPTPTATPTYSVRRVQKSKRRRVLDLSTERPGSTIRSASDIITETTPDNTKCTKAGKKKGCFRRFLGRVRDTFFSCCKRQDREDDDE